MCVFQNRGTSNSYLDVGSNNLLCPVYFTPLSLTRRSLSIALFQSVWRAITIITMCSAVFYRPWFTDKSLCRSVHSPVKFRSAATVKIDHREMQRHPISVRYNRLHETVCNEKLFIKGRWNMHAHNQKSRESPHQKFSLIDRKKLFEWLWTTVTYLVYFIASAIDFQNIIMKNI